MYADYRFYLDDFQGSAISPQDWPALARRADAFIDAITYQRLHDGWPVTDAVKNACCAVAEEIQAQQKYAAALSAAAAGIQSENNDGYSVTFGAYAESQAAYTAKLRDAADVYLPPSDPIRYAGFYRRGGYGRC